MTENKRQNEWEKENNLGKERKYFEGKCLASIKVSCQNTAALESRVTNAAAQTKVCRKEESQTCKNQPNKPIPFSTLTFLLNADDYYMLDP